MSDWVDLVPNCTGEEAAEALAGLGFAPKVDTASTVHISYVRGGDPNPIVLTLPMSGDIPRPLLMRQLADKGIYNDFVAELEQCRAEKSAPDT